MRYENSILDCVRQFLPRPTVVFMDEKLAGPTSRPLAERILSNLRSAKANRILYPTHGRGMFASCPFLAFEMSPLRITKVAELGHYSRLTKQVGL